MSISVTVCPKCGAGLINIVSGALCPYGCTGGPYPLLAAEQSRQNARAYKIAQLPNAAVLPGLRARKGEFADCRLFTVEGNNFVFRRVRRESQSLDKRLRERNVLANLDGAPIELTPAPPINGRVLMAELVSGEEEDL